MTMAEGLSFKSDATAVDAESAQSALRDHWGVEGGLRPLPGEYDQNYLVLVDGQARYVLKG